MRRERDRRRLGVGGGGELGEVEADRGEAWFGGAVVWGAGFGAFGAAGGGEGAARVVSGNSEHLGEVAEDEGLDGWDGGGDLDGC